MTKPHSKYNTELAKMVGNLDANLVYTPNLGGMGMASFQVTSAGSPDAVVFADLGLPDMQSTTYQVFVSAETGGTVRNVAADQSTLATTGFSILGGTSSDTLHVLVVGRFAGVDVTQA